MGTSTWHRSPDTEAWRRVRELYAQPDLSPRDVVSRIVAALGPETRARMSDQAVVTCLGTLVAGSQLVAAEGMASALAGLGAGGEPAAVQMAAGLRDRAEGLIAEHGFASRFGDLALEAVGTTALAMATVRASGAGILEVPLAVVEDGFSAFDREDRLHEVAALFTGYDLDRTFRYFVARDIGDFVGGEGLPTVGHANRLGDAVAAHCTDVWRSLQLAEYEELLVPTLRTPPAERVARLQPVMTAAVARGLDVLSAGGA